ncbi:NADH-quinone oxidoreductase subunit J [Thermosulfuriphilus ammonigenes]|uniref:NADH-quinone oxidoreductase subunit J n=1 Tax=Thermosulfuriphilus ammonigenes TaxID=1936021 RepID=A0A6G7PSY7_9BACT|nr:NADH-quinone oxidoreductase subunit J [Thermosulfuriphilus ammonigenes]MBA2849173.1 NADH-quinone oxidoreductase subunit J [Thermosulfuriphilus ammonigenes]QIJ70789.1 NADH-quinone oxidoreductase subunit J [Thermosulfuriphilus ammonigenes]
MDWTFLIFANLAIVAAFLMVVAKDPIFAALALLVVLISLAVQYIHLHAPLIAIFQITIYAGAILVLISYVIMLLSPSDTYKTPIKNRFFRGLGGVLGFVSIAILGLTAKGASDVIVHIRDHEFGSPEQIGQMLFSRYILHFEVVSVLLLVALIGAIYLAKKRL